MKALFDQVLTGASRRLLVWAFVWATLAGVSAVVLLALSGWFLTGAAVAGAGGAVAIAAFNYLLPSAAIRGLAITRTVARYGERLASHQAALRGMAGLRASLFARLAAQDSRTAPDLSGGDASARLIGDIDALEDLVVRRPARPAGLIAAATAVALAALAGWQAAAVLALLLAALPFALALVARRLTREPAREAAGALGELRTRYVDYAAARAEIAAYGLAPRIAAELAIPAARMDAARRRLFHGEGMIAGLLAAYASLCAMAMLLLGTGSAARVALAVLAAAASVEAMASFARTALRQASVRESLARIETLAALEAPGPRPSGDAAMPAPLTIGGDVFAPGSRIAITGASGSGKTMLLEGLAGIRPAAFDVDVGGTPLARASAAALRGQFALSPQDAVLIAGSIADNLRIARPGIGAEEIADALRVACLDTRVAAMERGVDTLLGDGGGILSGGERKRLSLARALLAKRPWLLLDEPTEGLDAATEAELVLRLGGWLDTTGTGLVLVSHRPAPLALARDRLPVESVPRLGV